MDHFSLFAAQVEGENRSDIKRRLLIKVLVPLAFVTCLVILIYSFRTTLHSYANKCNTPCGSCFNGMWGDSNLDSLSFASRDSHVGTLSTDVQNVGSKSPDLKVFKFADISAATNNFSCYNKLGEGGFGPVYKGKLRQGQEIAVKRLSKTSRQGYEEFKNEVMLTARLQHVNLVKVIGFCMEREEKMLVYEYLPNKSLDAFIFDPLKRLELDWEKRGRIIEGIIQGLVYLQEYSRLTIIHRDLKASNILLDKELSPKISDFGIARIFQKDAYEANTSHIVGTYGYVPPEYVKKGIYSTKYDVYSFGVLLLQIISGKRNDCFYGAAENLNLLEYAYELWMDGRGMEFIDPALDDSGSEYKVMRCMGIGLLCVQENQEDRPSMLQVLSMLKNETQPNMAPKRPAFSINAAGPDAQQNSRSWDQRRCSNYMDSTVSELETR